MLSQNPTPCRSLFWLIALALTLSACSAPTPTTMPTTAPDQDVAGPGDRLMTARANGMVTFQAMETIQALTPSPTPRPTSTPGPTPTPGPTATPPATSTPVLDALVGDLPYLRDGGAIPPGALARIGIGSIDYVFPNPQNNRLILTTSTGLYAYSMPGFERIWRRYLSGHPWEIDLSADGRYLATSYGFGGDPILFNSETGDRIGNLAGWYGAYISPDSQYVVAEAPPGGNALTATTGKLWLYSAETGTRIRAFEMPIAGFYGPVFGEILWSPDSRKIAVTTNNGLYVWDIETGEQLDLEAGSSIATLCDRYCSPSFSDDGRYLALEDNNSLYVIDFETLREVYSQPIIQYPAYRWAPNRILVQQNGETQVLDTTTWTVQHTFSINLDAIASSHDGSLFACKTDDGIVVLSADDFSERFSAKARGYHLSWSLNDMRLFVSGDDTNLVTIFDAKTGQQIGPDFTQQERIRTFDEDSILLFDRTKVWLLNLNTLQLEGGITFGIEAKSLAWSVDGEALIISAEDGEWYWSAADNAISRNPPSVFSIGPTVEIKEDDYRAPEISAVSPDGKLEASTQNDSGCGDGPYGGGCGAWGGIVNVVEGDSSQLLATFELEGGGASAFAWSTDSRYLAIGMTGLEDTLYSSRVIVIDARTGEMLYEFEGHLGQVTTLLFSPDGTKLASTGKDGTILIWNIYVK